jgi:hypothetical protein
MNQVAYTLGNGPVVLSSQDDHNEVGAGNLIILTLTDNFLALA